MSDNGIDLIASDFLSSENLTFVEMIKYGSGFPYTRTMMAPVGFLEVVKMWIFGFTEYLGYIVEWVRVEIMSKVKK